MMIKRAQDMKSEIRARMRGGDGQVEVMHLLDADEYRGSARLLARLTLETGCSIGIHDHQHEEEIFYCISGEGLLKEGENQPARMLQTGDAAINSAGQSHSIYNNGDQPLVLLAVILLTP